MLLRGGNNLSLFSRSPSGEMEQFGPKYRKTQNQNARRRNWPAVYSAAQASTAGPGRRLAQRDGNSGAGRQDRSTKHIAKLPALGRK